MLLECRLLGGRALQTLHTFAGLHKLHIRSLRAHLTTEHLNKMLQQLPDLTDLDIKVTVGVFSSRLVLLQSVHEAEACFGYLQTYSRAYCH